MSTRAKTKIVAAVLAACALWPPAHFALATQLEFDPWNFFGWAMYTTPAPRIEVTFAEIVGEQGRRIELPATLTAQAREFAERRSALGRLVAPDRLAEAILDQLPHIDGVFIGVRRWVLDPGTGMVEPRDQAYRYDR